MREKKVSCVSDVSEDYFSLRNHIVCHEMTAFDHVNTRRNIFRPTFDLQPAVAKKLNYIKVRIEIFIVRNHLSSHQLIKNKIK